MGGCEQIFKKVSSVSTLGQQKPQSPGRKGRNETPIPGDPVDKKRKKETGKPRSLCEDCNKDGIFLSFFVFFFLKAALKSEKRLAVERKYESPKQMDRNGQGTLERKQQLCLILWEEEH